MKKTFFLMQWVRDSEVGHVYAVPTALLNAYKRDSSFTILGTDLRKEEAYALQKLANS